MTTCNGWKARDEPRNVRCCDQMEAQQTPLEIVADNLANAAVAGFK
jgi:Flagella basal body rod protein